MRRRQRERIESLKEKKEEERKGQVLNRERERERERATFVRKIVSTRLQLCGRVGETKFKTFQFFYYVQVSPRCVGMKIRIFFPFYLLR